LIESIAKLKRGNTFKVISNLLKHKLIQHYNSKYDGYSLNYLGYDFLALHTLIKKNVLVGVGAKIGVGKESDIYFCYINPNCCLTNLEDENNNILNNNDKFCQSNQVKMKEKLDDDLDQEDMERYDDKDMDKDDDLKNIKNFELVESIIEQQKKKEEERLMQKNMDKQKLDEIDKKLDLSDDMENNEDKLDEDKEDINYEQQALDFSKIDHDIISKTGLKVAILKLARLGRTSFRAIKKKRDYIKGKTQYNWLYLSRISAMNEYKFLEGLHQNKFPVPRPIEANRHAIIMDYIPSFPLSTINTIPNKAKAYNDLVNIILKLANNGLVHGDFNEFNILVDDNQNMYIIDFPQVISIDHEEAEYNFNRDLKCIHDYFWKKFCINFDGKPDFHKDIKRESYLDVELNAYGCKKLKEKKIKKKKIEKIRKLKVKEDDLEDNQSNEEDEEEDNDDNDEVEEKKDKEEDHIENFLEKNMKDDIVNDDEFLNMEHKIKELELLEVDIKNKKETSNTMTQIKDNTIKVIKKDIKNFSKSNRYKK